MNWIPFVCVASLAIAGCAQTNESEERVRQDGSCKHCPPDTISPRDATCPIPGIALTRAFGALRFREPTGLIAQGSRLYVLEKQGTIRVFADNPDVTQSTLFADLTDRVNKGWEEGLLGLVFDPDFATNGELYITYNTFNNDSPVQIGWRLSRFVSRDGGLTLDRTSETILIDLRKTFPAHNGGNLAFGPDGFLYLALGDGGSSNDPNGNGQNTSVLFGKFLRLNVHQRPAGAPYTIPADNPFINGGGRPEIYATGFRNPWRWSFDSVTGQLWMGDVGQDAFEEVNQVILGGNYGWSAREASHCNPFSGTRCDGPFIDPVAEFPHSQMRSITGGYVYRGTAMPRISGMFVFGDFYYGGIFGLPISGDRGPINLLNTGKNFAAFGQDSAGELYAVDYGRGEIYKLIEGPCQGEQPGGGGREYLFLMRDGIGTEDSAFAYYTAISQPELTTLNGWIRDRIGPGPVNSAVYRNANDLGFIREMTCSREFRRGSGGCFVRNWRTFEDFESGDLERNLGTVAMDVSPEGFTRFYVFNTGGGLSPKAVLDSEGEKFAPQLCTMCHGGNWSGPGGNPDLGSVFREFEPSLLEARPGISPELAEAQWFALNESVRSANAALRNEEEGSPSGFDAARAALTAYMDNMYDRSGSTPRSRPVGDPIHIPPSWRTADQNQLLVQTKRDLWTRTVAPYCMGCHRLNNIDFSDYRNFRQLAAEQNGKTVLERYIQADPADPNRTQLAFMPQAELTFNLLTADTAAKQAIDEWLIQANDPVQPRCRVDVEFFAGFTEMGQDIYVVGSSAELGGWEPSFGVKLSGFEFPRWRGRANLPQGQSVEWKGVMIDSRFQFPSIRWENGFNRRFTVPNASTFSVSGRWRF